MKRLETPRELTHAQAMELLSSRNERGYQPLGAYYIREQDGRFVGIDNTTGEAWVEEFGSLSACFRFLTGKENPEQQKTAASAGNRRSGRQNKKPSSLYHIDFPLSSGSEGREKPVSYLHDLPDHPAIAACERTGYPPGREPKDYVCPVCGAECETIYLTSGREPVGCDVCLESQDIYDYYEEE